MKTTFNRSEKEKKVKWIIKIENNVDWGWFNTLVVGWIDVDVNASLQLTGKKGQAIANQMFREVWFTSPGWS